MHNPNTGNMHLGHAQNPGSQPACGISYFLKVLRTTSMASYTPYHSRFHNSPSITRALVPNNQGQKGTTEGVRLKAAGAWLHVDFSDFRNLSPKTDQQTPCRKMGEGVSEVPKPNNTRRTLI